MADDFAARVVSRQVGIVASTIFAQGDKHFDDGVHMCSARSGSLAELYPDIHFFLPPGQLGVLGSGAGLLVGEAYIKAIAETIERYALAVYRPTDIQLGAAISLANTFDWSAIPVLFSRVPNSEQWRPILFNPESLIRWIPATSLRTGNEVLVPLVMARIHVPPGPGESFCFQASSGSAVHTSYLLALQSALLELVERDTVEIVWMTRLSLPEIQASEFIDPAWLRLSRLDDSHFVRQRYFDASSILGVPTVYAVRQIKLPLGHDTIVTCASSLSLQEAALKTRIDASAQQLMRIHEVRDLPYSRFKDRTGSLTADALPTAPNLDFLSQGVNEKTIRVGLCTDLDGLIRRLLQHSELYVVETTTDEMRDVGLAGVRVIAPGLLSVSMNDEKYLEHPRLRRTCPQTTPPHETLNLAPQPFC